MRPLASSLAVLAAGVAGLLAPPAVPAQADAQARTAGIVCGLINGVLPGPVGDVAGRACDTTGGVISGGIGAINDITVLHLPTSVGGAVSSLAQAGANTVLNGVSGWIASGAVWLMSRVSDLIESSTHPQLTSGWFAARYRTMVDLAFALALPLLLLAVLRSLWTRDLAELGRSVLVYLPLAAVLTGAAVVVTQMGIDVTDQLSSTVSHSVGGDAHSFMQGATKGMIIVGAGSAAAGAPELPGFVVAIGAIVAACGAFVLWIELVLREAAIYVAVMFLPLSFVALIWPATARVARRAVEALAAIVLSKFVVVAIIALAASGLVHSGLGDSFSAALAGIALMLLACFAPWALLKMLPLMEAAVAHHGHTRAAFAGAPYKAMRAHDVVRNAMRANHGGGESTSGGGLAPSAGGVKPGGGAGGATRTAGSAAAGTGIGLAVAGAAAAGNAAARRAKTGGTAANAVNGPAASGAGGARNTNLSANGASAQNDAGDSADAGSGTPPAHGAAETMRGRNAASDERGAVGATSGSSIAAEQASAQETEGGVSSRSAGAPIAATAESTAAPDASEQVDRRVTAPAPRGGLGATPSGASPIERAQRGEPQMPLGANSSPLEPPLPARPNSPAPEGDQVAATELRTFGDGQPAAGGPAVGPDPAPAPSPGVVRPPRRREREAPPPPEQLIPEDAN